MFRRTTSSNRDMVALGGWIFADLLLGLAMLFFTANTVGLPPPTPTPLPTPNLLATEKARSGAMLAMTGSTATAAAKTAEALASEVALGDEALATAAARATDQALAQLQGTATAEALLTREAMSADARATMDAQATETALASQATVAAIATAAASDRTAFDATIEAAATSAAVATLAAAAAQETITALEAQDAANAATSTAVSILATSAAAAGQTNLGDALATIDAMQAAGQLTSADLATAEAEGTSVAATIEALNAMNLNLQAEATALAQVALSGSLNPSAVTETIQVDLQGMLNGDEDAMNDARTKLQSVMAKYPAPECRAGFVLISGAAPTLGDGVNLAQRIEEILWAEYPTVFEDEKTGRQRFWTPSEGGPPDGTVEIDIFFYNGCSPVTP